MTALPVRLARAAAASDALIDHLFEFARATLPDT